MNKELQWLIAKIMAWYNSDYEDWSSMAQDKKDMWFARAEDIMDSFKEAGYRKVSIKDFLTDAWQIILFSWLLYWVAVLFMIAIIAGAVWFLIWIW